MKLLFIIVVLYGVQVKSAFLNEFDLRTSSVLTPENKKANKTISPNQNDEQFNTILTRVTAGLLPRAKKGKRNFIRLAELAPLNRMNDRDRLADNARSRRVDTIVLYVKKPAYNKPLKSDLTQYSQLFDEKGMLYITKPVLDEDRKLNSLLNKVVKYNSDKNRYLRQPLSTAFEKEELKSLKTIVEALNGKDGPATPKSIYEFNELVA